jgi:hypothetical protein
MGETGEDGLRLYFDSRVRLKFHGATITTDADLLACRELDDALGLTEAALMHLQERGGGRNAQHGWSHYCASRHTAVWPATRTLTMPNI